MKNEVTFITNKVTIVRYEVTVVRQKVTTYIKSQDTATILRLYFL